MVMGCGGCSKQIYGILMLIALTITEVHSRDHVYYTSAPAKVNDWNSGKIFWDIEEISVYCNFLKARLNSTIPFIERETA